LTAIESQRTARRSLSDYSDAELVDMIHGRRLTPEERAIYMRKFEAEADVRHAISKAESEAKWDAINKARILETSQRGERGVHATGNERGNHVNAN